MAYGFYQAGSYTSRHENPWAYYYAAQDTDALLPTGDWRQLLSASRFLFTNQPLVRSAIMEQASYSFPIEPQFTGSDKKWGKTAALWLHDWESNCCVRGGAYDGQSISRLRLIGRKIDGDITTVLVQDDDGWPRIQLIRAHRIGSRSDLDGNSERKVGPYKGREERNGVITDKYGRMIAVHILGKKPEEDRFIAAGSAFMSYRPTESDQSRGIPELCASIQNYADIKRLREYEMRAQQLQASYAVVERNETGQADLAEAAFTLPDSAVDPSGSPSGLVTKTYGAGTVQYFKAMSGSGLELVAPSRPGKDAQDWEDKIVTQAFLAMEWEPSLGAALKEPGGAWARVILQKVNRAIQGNVDVEAKAKRIETAFALATAIENGLLPAPSDGDFWSWNFKSTVPALTADSGNESSADRDAYKLGLDSLQGIITSRGEWWEELREQREIELRDLLTRAKAVQGDFPELTFTEALDLLEQRTPNGKASQPPAANGDDSGKTADNTAPTEP